MERQALTVSELNRLVKEMLDETALFKELWIEGEITNFRAQSSGHLYFSLRDETAQIRCVMFVGKARLLRFRPQDDQKVVVCGAVSLYERDGQYQFIAEQMEPLGIGGLALAFEQLKQRLAMEGLFAEERKRKLPLYPKTVGIVTSPSGAALRDMVKIIWRRFPGVHIILAPSLVQGEGAAEQIAAGIYALNTLPEVEVIIVGRGGGSQEDLWCFNEEAVARAVASSAKPIISAVGHETDYSLADMAADLRAATPSAAAELVVPEAALLLRDLETIRQRTLARIHQHLRSKQENLVSLGERIDAKKLQNWTLERRWRLEEHREKLHSFLVRRLSTEKQSLHKYRLRLLDDERLASAIVPRKGRITSVRGLLQITIQHRLSLEHAHLTSYDQRLQLLDPSQTMTRGYAIIRDSRNLNIITSVSQMRFGDDVELELSDGQATARVIQTVPKGDMDNG